MLIISNFYLIKTLIKTVRERERERETNDLFGGGLDDGDAFFEDLMMRLRLGCGKRRC